MITLLKEFTEFLREYYELYDFTFLDTRNSRKVTAPEMIIMEFLKTKVEEES